MYVKPNTLTQQPASEHLIQMNKQNNNWMSTLQACERANMRHELLPPLFSSITDCHHSELRLPTSEWTCGEGCFKAYNNMKQPKAHTTECKNAMSHHDWSKHRECNCVKCSNCPAYIKFMTKIPTWKKKPMKATIEPVTSHVPVFEWPTEPRGLKRHLSELSDTPVNEPKKARLTAAEIAMLNEL